MISGPPQLMANRDLHRNWRRCTRVAGLVATACLLAGCVQSLPTSELPPLAKDPRPVLTAEQQKAAMGELAAKKDSKRAEALKEIETTK